MEARAVARYVRVSPRKARAGRRPRPRQVRGRGGRHPALLAARCGRDRGQGAEQRRGQRREQPEAQAGDAVRVAGVRRRGSDARSASSRARWAGRSGSTSARATSPWSSSSERRRRPHGSESLSDRVPARHHRGLAFALVRRQGLQEDAGRGPEDPQVPDEAPQPRRPLAHRDRAQGRQGRRRPVDRPSGHRHRQEGHRGRRPAQGPREARPGIPSRSTSSRSSGRSSTRRSSRRASPSSSRRASASAAR